MLIKDGARNSVVPIVVEWRRDGRMGGVAFQKKNWLISGKS